MATFLVNRKMHPALADRLHASVRGERASVTRLRSRRHGRARVPLILRLAVLLVALGISSFLSLRHRRAERHRVDDARANLLADLRAQTGTLTLDDLETLERAEEVVTRAIGPYEGDTVASELHAPGALARTLATSAIYVRGPMEALANPASRGDTVLASTRDTLVRCLINPPSSRMEATIFENAKATYAGSPAERFGGVESLRDVALAMPLLVPAWGARVRSAETVEDIAKLQRDVDHAPVASAARGAKARVLLFALDEASDPADAKSPTELDGERAHAVRIELVDLRATKVLLRLRRRVDPSWISTPRHAEYASGMDGCRLAMDVQMAVLL